MKKKPKFKTVELHNEKIKMPIEIYDEIYKEILQCMSAELFVFLTKNKAIKKFINYSIADYYYCGKNAPFSLYINISTAFGWYTTKEGYEFWCKLHHEFEKQL